MVKDAPNNITMNMIVYAQNSRKITEDGNILIFLVVLFTLKALWPSVQTNNRSQSGSHYLPYVWRLIQYVYENILIASAQH